MMITSKRVKKRKHGFLQVLSEGSLGLVLLAGIIILSLSSLFIALDVLQMDFTAYYTAGESLNAGLSPYLNQIEQQPPIWDGINPFVFSRFQYPPAAAMLFQGLAALPYLAAKSLWILLSLASAVVSVWLTARVFPLAGRMRIILAGIGVCTFFPLYTLLERGQVDGVTLLLLVAAISLMLRDGRGWEWLGGGLIALAILFKLYSIFLLPFLILRRRWNVLAGVAIASLALLAISLFTPGGFKAWQEYIFEVMPRIGMHIEDSNHGRVDPALVESLSSGAGQDATILDGRIYRLRGFNFSTNASFVRVILDECFDPEAPVSRIALSAGVYLLLFLPFLLTRRLRLGLQDPRWEFLYWQMAFVVTLLAAPLTWTMNVVWLLPVSVVILAEFGQKPFRISSGPMLLLVIGFFLAAMPDHKFLGLVGAFEKTFWNHKYVLAELLVLAGGMWRLSQKTARPGSSSRGKGIPA